MYEILIRCDPNLYRVASCVGLLGLGSAETSNARAALAEKGLLGDPRQGPPEVSHEDVTLGCWSIRASIVDGTLESSEPLQGRMEAQTTTDAKNVAEGIFEVCKVEKDQYKQSSAM
jgi:hypothetical protein